jgi:hypothetical protein
MCLGIRVVRIHSLRIRQNGIWLAGMLTHAKDLSHKITIDQLNSIIIKSQHQYSILRLLLCIDWDFH